MQEREKRIEIVRRAAMVTANAFAEESTYREIEEKVKKYFELISDDLSKDSDLLVQTFNTFLLGYTMGALAGSKNKLKRGQRKACEKMVIKMKEADFTKFPSQE